MKSFIDSNYYNVSGVSDAKCVRRCTLLHLFSKTKRDECISSCPDSSSITDNNTMGDATPTMVSPVGTNTIIPETTSQPKDIINSNATNYTPPVDESVQNFINFLKNTSDAEFQTIYTFFGTINDQIKKGYNTSKIVSNFGGNSSNPADVDYITNLVKMYKNPQVLQTVLSEAGRRKIITNLQTENLSDLITKYKAVEAQKPGSVSNPSIGIGAGWKIGLTVVALSAASFILWKIFHHKGKNIVSTT